MALFDQDLFKPPKKPLAGQTQPGQTPQAPQPPKPGIVAPPEQPSMENLLGTMEQPVAATTPEPTGIDWRQRTIPSLGGQTVEEFFQNTPWRQSYGQQQDALRQQQLTALNEATYWWNQAMANPQMTDSRDPDRPDVVDPMWIQQMIAELEEKFPGVTVSDMSRGPELTGELPEQIDWTQMQPDPIRDDQGNIIATGYWYNNQFYIDQDLRRMAEFQYDAESAVRDVPTLQEWMEQQGKQFGDIQESTAWEDLQNFYAQLNDPNTLQDWQGEGLRQAGTLLGTEDYEGDMQSLLGQLEGGIGGQMGLGAGEASDMDRKLQLDIQQLTQEATQITEALAASGRSSQAFNSAIQARSQIANMQLQHGLAKAELDWARKSAEFAAKEDRYKVMVETGQMTVDRYVAQKYQNASLKMASYAQEIAMISAANKDYLMQYQEDLSSMEMHINLMYASMMADLDMDESMIAQMQETYNMMLAPIYTQMEMAKLRLAEEALDAQTQQGLIASMIEGLGIFANTVVGIGGLL